MLSQFRHVALIGKYQTTGTSAAGASSRKSLDEIAHYLMDQGCEVVMEKDTANNTGDASIDATVGLRRAEELYDRVFFEYGDDSVAQLGGVHLACEQASNVLTKVLEWGRLMAYLEQSTRYIAYDARIGGRYRFYRDPALLGTRWNLLAAFSDSSAGFGLVLHQVKNPDNYLSIDSVKDFYELTQIKMKAKTSGLVIIGGGSPKNFAPR